jgi:hypothetical protein
LYGAFEVKHLFDSRLHFLSSGHFFGSTAPQAFFRPDRNSQRRARAGAVKVGRRFVGPTYSTVFRPHLYSPEHGGRLVRSGLRKDFSFIMLQRLLICARISA